MSAPRSSASSHALSIDEIVSAIVEHIEFANPGPESDTATNLPPSRDLFALATVNRTFSNRALDRLWERTNLWRLTCLIPKHLWNIRMIDRHRRTWIIGADQGLLISEEDWTVTKSTYILQLTMPGICTAGDLLQGRFFSYSKRVRHLVCSPVKTGVRGARAVDDDVLEVWQEQQRNLFPSLTGVTLHTHGGMRYQTLSTVMNFLQEDIKVLNIEFNGMVELEKQQLATLCGYTHNIRQLSCKDTTSEVGYDFFESLIGGAPHLEVLHSEGLVSWDALVGISSSPYLRELRGGEIWGNQPIEGRLGADAFPSLEFLELEDSCDDASLLRKILNDISGKHLREVHLMTRNAGDLTLAYYNKLCACLVRYSSLSKVVLDVWINVKSSLSDDAELVEIGRAVLGPLTALTTLEHLEVMTSHELTLNEDNIMAIMPSWPRLRTLRLLRSYSDWNPHVLHISTTLPVLSAVLARCGILTTHPFVVDCTALPHEDMIMRLAAIRHAFAGPLMVTTIGEVDALAAVLRRAMPRVISAQAEMGAPVKNHQDARTLTRALHNLLAQDRPLENSSNT